MEELRSSGARYRAGATLSRKIPNGSAAASSAYDDVFGGPPRYSGPFAARMGDYSEIFGGLASSCSIPVLDLPPALDGYEAPADARSSGFDYSEIFGCLDGGDFAVSYEELVAERERVEGEPKGQEAFSSNGRAPKETEFGKQVTEASETSPNGANRYVASLENDEISSNSTHSDDGSKQFNMSYHKTSHGNIVDALSENTHTTQLHAVPGFAFDVEARPPYSNIRSHNRPNMVTQDLSVDAGLDGGISDRKQGKMLSPSSAANSKCSENNLETDQKQFFTDCPTSEYGPANLKIHSRSSSNHSTSSGDIYFPDATYLTISDISLRTQPLPVPPPSRLPPKLVNNHENPKMKIYANSKADLGGGGLNKPMLDHQKHYDWVASRIHAPQECVRDSSCFFDVEVDASSAAAASAAAMKEAMEQAQARLKSAKESMERKRETLQSRKKLGQHEGTKHKAGKEDKTVQEVKIFSQVVTEKDLVKAAKKSDFFSEEKEKVRKAAKVAPDREEKERHVVSDEQRQQTMQGNEFKSSQASILNEKSGEWKTDTQFYELVNNEKKFRPIKEVSDKICAEKMPEETTVVIKEKENGRTDVEVAYEFVSNGNSWEADEIREKNENATKSQAGNTACREEEIKELPNLISEACVQEQLVSQVEEIYGFHQQVKDEKLVEAQEVYISEEEVKKINAGVDVPACGENKKNLEFFDDDCKLEGHESEEKGSKLEAAKVVCGCEDREEVTCQPHESEKKLELANKTCTQDGNQKETRVPHGVCMWEVGEKVEAAHEASQCENSERTRGSAIVECCYEESKNKLKGTGLASEQEESKKPNRTEGLCMFVENESKHKVAQEGDELEENLEKLTAGGAIGRKENEKILVEEACRREYNERITRDGKLQGQQNDKKQTAAQVSFELENSKDLTVVELDHGKKENGNIKEVHVAIDLKEKHKMFNAAQEAFQTAVNRDLEDLREARLSEKKGNILCSAQQKTDFRTVVTGNTTDMRKKGERENERRIEREREQEKVQTRKLEEEKEREREREKDRLAVERATREAHERAFAEARERAERIAVKRVTAEARQRALAESREKAERASAEALEKSLAEKASREARLRAERAAVERATAEARERAVERALAEKAAADARERAEKLSGSSRDRMRKDNETEEQFRGRDKGDGGTRDFPHDAQFQSASSSSNGQRHSGEVESALRCKARLERHQRTFERAAKALAEKNLRDILAQREQAERNRLAETLDADVRRWSNGKEGNLRALLSTLQYILGPESGWQPIPLTDVITAAAAKKAYRKATLCVHPDKLQQRGASIQQKYVCEKVFDLLKEAWNRFNSEER